MSVCNRDATSCRVEASTREGRCCAHDGRGHDGGQGEENDGGRSSLERAPSSNMYARRPSLWEFMQRARGEEAQQQQDVSGRRMESGPQ